jgi:iron complex transport system ATP-binding protein
VLLLRAGRTLAAGSPNEALSAELLQEAYGIPFQVVGDPIGPRAILPKVER